MTKPDVAECDLDDDTRGDNPTKDGLSQQAPPGEVSHGGVEGEAVYGYGRQGEPIVVTGTRTDVPVGIEQIESSKAYQVTPDGALERQGFPPPHPTEDEHDEAMPMPIEE